MIEPKPTGAQKRKPSINWEIEDALIRLENQMYDHGERSPSNDRYTVEEYIKELLAERQSSQAVCGVSDAEIQTACDLYNPHSVGGMGSSPNGMHAALTHFAKSREGGGAMLGRHFHQQDDPSKSWHVVALMHEQLHGDDGFIVVCDGRIGWVGEDGEGIIHDWGSRHVYLKLTGFDAAHKGERHE